jgi:hypothetical protein
MPNPPSYSETGHLPGQCKINLPPYTPEGEVFGDLVSLGGIRGKPNFGRVLSSNSFTVGVGTFQVASVSNPQRVAAIIENLDDGAAPGSQLYVYLGGLNTIPFILQPYGTFQIDKNFPWTGDIWVNSNAGSPICVINEVSVP